MKRIISAVFAVLLLTGNACAAIYDVVVVGAGSGGTGAAIQAARMGARVALVEESDWIGGQMTAAAVSTMDDQWRTRWGIYGEFISRVKKHYDAVGKNGKNISTGLWAADTVCFEPKVGQSILRQMLNEAGMVDIITMARPVSADVQDGAVKAAMFMVNHFTPLRVEGKIFIDATECGDFIPLTGARYRSGNTISPNIDQNAQIQDITQVALIKRYVGGLSENLVMEYPPAGYGIARDGFAKVVTKGGSRWGQGGAPYDMATHNAYRAVPDSQSSLYVDSASSDTWPNITKTGINWVNDYPGAGTWIDDYIGAKSGLTARYLEDRLYRKRVDLLAAMKTLQFIYYMQTELGGADWSVDKDAGYSGFHVNYVITSRIGYVYRNLLAHFPPIPYVRESRRLVGLYTMNYFDTVRDKASGAALNNFPSAMALGEYQVDLHGGRGNVNLERDLGETESLFPKGWVGSEGVYQIPFEVFVPESVDGLLAAEKNISVSRMVNGTIRLQPVTMHTGQACGAIAALATRQGTKPREVNPVAVQFELLKSGVQLALGRHDDVTPDSQWWTASQMCLLYGLLEPVAGDTLAPDLPISRAQASALLGRIDRHLGSGGPWVTRGEISAAAGLLKPAGPDEPASRGYAINAALEALLGKTPR